MSQTNFLIGRGELLTHDIKGPKRKPGKAEVTPCKKPQDDSRHSSQQPRQHWTPCRQRPVLATSALHG